MLARLDEIPGVAESRVDWPGKRFLLTLEAGAKTGRVGVQAAETLGEGARLLGRGEAGEVLDSYRKGETWMLAEETPRLSRFEAGVLAQRHGEEAGVELGLNAGSTRKLVALFEQEFSRAFERAHAGKIVEAVPHEFEVAAERILESSAGFLPPEQKSALAEYLEGFSVVR